METHEVHELAHVVGLLWADGPARYLRSAADGAHCAPHGNMSTCEIAQGLSYKLRRDTGNKWSQSRGRRNLRLFFYPSNLAQEASHGQNLIQDEYPSTAYM